MVVVQKADVYMFDEPSSYLDVKQRLQVRVCWLTDLATLAYLCLALSSPALPYHALSFSAFRDVCCQSCYLTLSVLTAPIHPDLPRPVTSAYNTTRMTNDRQLLRSGLWSRVMMVCQGLC